MSESLKDNLQAGANDNGDKVADRLKTIFIASVVAICGNVAIGIFKGIVGLVTNSIAITMDAINNFTDAGSSFITILSSYFAAKDPDKKHPFGYGRTEYLGTLLIAIIILYAGVTSFVESVRNIIKPQAAAYSTVSLVIIIVAVFIKAALTIYLIKMGKKANSDSLTASGKEAIGDIAISLATIVAAFIYIYAHISIEAWLGAIIAALIVKTGVEILMETVAKILGTGGDAALVRSVKEAIAQYDQVLGAYDLVLHNYGPDSYLASIHLEVEDTMTMDEFDDLSRKIQEDISNRFGVHLSAIGVYSVNTQNTGIIDMREDIKKIALATEYVNQIHGFYVNEDTKNMRFDVVISFGTKDRRGVYNQVIAKVQEKYPDYTIFAGMDSDYNEVE